MLPSVLHIFFTTLIFALHSACC